MGRRLVAAHLVVAGRALALEQPCCPMPELDRLLARLRPPDEAARRAAQRAFDLKTKPRGSLGRLEQVAAQLAALEGVAVPARPNAVLVVAAGDHGVAEEGVSAYPQEVTRQMVANFAAGGAAINVLAREADARLVVVDTGVVEPCADPAVRAHRFGAGTANIARGPAMPRDAAVAAVVTGAALAGELLDDGFDLIAARRDGDREHDPGRRPLRVSAPRRAGRGLRSRNRDRRRGARAQDRGRRPRARRQRPGRAGTRSAC